MLFYNIYASDILQEAANSIQHTNALGVYMSKRCQRSSRRSDHHVQAHQLQRRDDNAVNLLLHFFWMYRVPQQQSPLLSQQVPCKIGQSVPHGPSLHLLPSQVLHHIAGHYPNSYLVAREDGWIGQARVCLWVAASQAVQRQGGLREDSMVVYVTNGRYKYHLAVGSSAVQKPVYPFDDLSKHGRTVYQQSKKSRCGIVAACRHNVYWLHVV